MPPAIASRDTVRRDGLEIRSPTLGAKERMTVRSADGTREVAVPRILRERFALDDASVRAAAELALRRLSQSLLLDQGRDASALFVACAVAASLAAALSPLLEDRPAPDPVAA